MDAERFGFLANYRGGIIGVGVYLILTVIMFIIAFMTAFGNPSATAEIVLSVVEVYFRVLNPLWGIPMSYLLGAYLLRPR